VKRKIGSLTFEVVEVPAEEGTCEDMLDFLAELLVRRWLEQKGQEDDDARSCDLRNSNNPSQA